jgi:hypothetical protein
MKLFALLLMVLSISATAAIGPVARSANKTYAGAAENVEKEYINVLNKSGGSLTAGQIVVWDVDNDDGASVEKSTSAYAIPACMITKACASNAICKECQVYGYTSQLLFGAAQGNATAGRCLYINEADSGYVQATADGSVDAKDECVGMIYDAASATGAVEAFLKMK